MGIRPPYVAGAFYPGDIVSLIQMIKNCFLDKHFGPGSLPGEKKTDIEIIGGIAPHAGYTYSGPCAAHLYKRISESRIEKPTTIVILGTNHSGFGHPVSIHIGRNWKTPLGIVEIDRKFGEMLLDTELFVEDASAHSWEHSVEVQLPFLQYIFHNEFKLVPIVVSHISFETMKMIGEKLYDLSGDYKRRIIVIASSDFTHHGYQYGYVLFKTNQRENVTKLDMNYIDDIINLNTKDFLNKIEKFNGTVCGYNSIGILMEYVKKVGGRGRLLKYYNSGDITGDENLIVGYASISFEKSNS